ncbi:MAG: nucleotide exchange factor GrpE [Pseudomonadota bacterium]|jgi:molecular chaperone GrpE
MSQTPGEHPPTAAEVLASQAAATPSADAENPHEPQSVPEGADEAGHAETVASLQAKLAEREDQLMRLAAEIENMRRRHATELSNASKFAIETFAEAMLPVADSMEMALSLPDQTLDGLRGGVELTLRQLQQAFERGRLKFVSPAGEKFNPNHHQAVSMVDGASAQPPVPSGHVVAVMQKGYLIGERVLRPALVVVAQ